MRKKFLGMLPFLAVLTLIAGGCGGEEGVKVTGSVTKASKPLESVTVSFVALDKEKGVSKGAVTNAEGKFELLLKPGKYTVTLTKLVDSKGNVPKASDNPNEDFAQLEAQGKLKQIMPQIYSSFDHSQFNDIEIPAGGKQLAPFDTK